MQSNLETIDVSKYLLLKKIINNAQNNKIYNHYDEEIIRKKFSNEAELSSTENIITISAINMKNSEVKKIVENFVNIRESKKIYDKRNIYEIVKISNLPQYKINNAIPQNLLVLLAKQLEFVSRETNLISFDFLVLRCLDALITKINDSTLHIIYKKIQNNLIRKLVTFAYIAEKREKTTIYLCWIDRILQAAINKEITVDEYIDLTNKLLRLIPFSFDVSWKILHCINFLLFQPDFSDKRPLCSLKRKILNDVKNHYYFKKQEEKDVENLMIKTLAKQAITKEDFYYLFDSIKILFQKSEKAQVFCLNLLKYLLYIDNKQNIFCYRFIREYFLGTLSKILQKETSIKLKEEEFRLLILLFHNETFFFLHKKTLLKNLILLLNLFEEDNTNITRNKYYKYCDVLDYILSKNTDAIDEDLLKILPHDKNKISKRFQLFLSTYKI